jgi:hypothetical protein
VTAVGTVRVLEEDPDLGARLHPEGARAAARSLVARCRAVSPGAWRSPEQQDEPGFWGLLVLDGLLGVRVQLEDRSHLEVLGQGDLLRPWVDLGPYASTPSSVDWVVFEAARLAVLDRRFAASACRWPEVPSALMGRLVLRARRLSFQHAVASVRGVDERLELMLWHFADRWGRVAPEGVRLGLALSHAELAEVVGASRQSVSTALMDLRRRRSIEHAAPRTWILHGDPPRMLHQLSEQVALAAS